VGVQGPADPLVLICGADDRYTVPLAVMLRSVAEHLGKGRTARAFVLDGGMREESRTRLERIIATCPGRVRVEWITPDPERLAGLRTMRRMSSAVYLCLLAPDLLPSEVGRAIYLDSDVVVQADLDELWDQALGDRSAWAAQNYRPPYIGGTWGIERYRELGLDAEAPYFNTGVLVMNLVRWREERVSERAREYLRTHAEVLNYHDQEALNAVLAGTWGRLDPSWNVLTSIYWLDEWPESPFRAEIAARREELMRINGIEESGADAILRYREEHGPFKSLEDLDPIPGFNRERVENFEDRFRSSSARS
jgi:competence ComEA-like helix-hairpin-helix protein